MTDKEIMEALEDNKIVEALECCLSDNPPCYRCKYDANAFTVDECMGKLMKDALDLINRQQRQLDNYSHNVRNMSKDFIDQQKIIQEQQAEIKWKTTYMHSLQLSMEEIKPQIKANAIKEFAERLKGTVDLDTFGKLDYAISIYDIDNLVKEMVGEGK